MSYGMSLTLARPFDDAVAAVREVLAGQGFGIVSEIDMQQTLRNKLGLEIDRNLILGACNPGFANRALQAEPSSRSRARWRRSCRLRSRACAPNTRGDLSCGWATPVGAES